MRSSAPNLQVRLKKGARIGAWSLSGMVPYSFLACVAGGFAFPTIASWSLLFYITLTPAVLLRLARGWQPDWHDHAFVTMLALCGWSTLTLLWGDNLSGHGDSWVYWLRNAGCTVIFLLGFMMAQAEDILTRERLILTLVYSGAANAILSIGIFLAHGAVQARLIGWGITRNPVLGAAIIGICLILATGRAVTVPRQRARMFLLAMPMAVYLALTFSRTPLAATLIALAILGLSARRRIWACLGLGLPALIAGIVAMQRGMLTSVIQGFTARGSDCHVFIWRTSWEEILHRPLLGYGPMARLPVAAGGWCPPYPSPHNLYLSLLFYSGMIGLVLFAGAVTLLARQLVQNSVGFARRQWLAVGTLPLIVGMSDLTQVIKGPSPLWYIIWVPMLLVLTVEKGAGGGGAVSATALAPADQKFCFLLKKKRLLS